MAKEDFKKLIEENKRQTKLLNTIAGEEGTETAIESLTDTVEQQGKDAKRVAAGEKAWQTRQERQNSVSGAAETETKREQSRVFKGILGSISGVKSGVMGLGGMLNKKFKEGASKLGGSLKGMLSKLLIGGALAAFIAFMNSPYWEKTKKVIMEDIIPVLVNVYENVLVPLFNIIKDVFVRQFENIKELFSGVGDAITKFQEGDILGGITTLIGSLGTFFIDTIDNLITGVYNLFAGLFGLESTDSVFGSISKFVTDTLKSIKDFFVGIYDGVVGLFTDPVGTLTSMWTGIVGEGGLLDIIFAPIDSAVNWIMGIFGWSTEDGTDFSLRTFITGAINDVVTKIKEIFALGEEMFGDFALFKFVTSAVGDVVDSIKAIFSGDFSMENLLKGGMALFDLVFSGINLAVNAIKDIFGFGNPDEPFRLSEFVIETFAKIGEFFKSLLDIDVRGLASGILPETVVDFLFGKEVDQSSDEFKSMSALDQAQATGLYDKDLIGNSELNQNLLGGASDSQLQAILDDEDISEDNIKAIKAEQAKRSSAGEFSGSGKFEEKVYAVEPASRRTGQFAFRATPEYEEILLSMAGGNAPFPKKLKVADLRYKSAYGNPNIAPVGSNSGQAVAQGTAGAQEAASDANQTVIVNNQQSSAPASGGSTPIPMTTRDNSSASQIAAVAG